MPFLASDPPARKVVAGRLPVGGLPVNRAIAASFLVVALVWGSTWIVIKDQISQAEPGWAITWRFAAATLGMVVLATVRRESLRLPAPALAVAVLVGLFQFCANFQFVYRAEHYLTSGVVAVSYALLMVPNALLARIFLGQGLTRRFLAGSLVALCGIALLLLHEWRAAPPGARIWLGAGLTLCGLLCASIANVAQGTRAVRSVGAVPLIAWAMFFGTLANTALALAAEGLPRLDPHPRYWAGVAYLALVGSVLTFPIYFSLIRRMGAGRAAYNGVAVPIVAMVISTLLEGYRWTGLAAAGSALALAGLLIALAATRPRPG